MASHYPYAMRTELTIVVRNAAGLEEKRVHEAYFGLDEASIERPWFVLVNFLAPNYAKKHFGVQGQGWVRIEQALINEVINRENPSEFFKIPVRVMTLNQLKAYSDLKELGFDPYEFPTVQMAREMMMLRIEDPSGYENQLAEFRFKRSGEDKLYDKYRQGSVEPEELTSDEFNALKQTSQTNLDNLKETSGVSKRNKLGKKSAVVISADEFANPLTEV